MIRRFQRYFRRKRYIDIDQIKFTPVKMAIIVFSMIFFMGLVEIILPTPTVRQINALEAHIKEVDERVKELEKTQRCRVNYESNKSGK